MRSETLLLRQIHPSFVQAGRVTSQAFRPTPKDEYQLSVDNGDLIQAEAVWQRFTANPERASVGVQAVAAATCQTHDLPVIEDGQSHPEHCAIDFSAFEKKDIERKAKALRSQAEVMGWLFVLGGAA